MSLILVIKVIPSSGRQAWSLDRGGQLKCHLRSAPEGGEANRELLKFLAKSLNITLQSVNIISGGTSRHKRIAIDLNITVAELLDRLGIAKQQTLF